MMEQPDACKRHSDAVFVASHDDMIVADAATSLGDELHATLMGTLDIVAEGEEGIRAEGYLRVLGYPGFLLFHRQHLWLRLEELLPGTVAKHVVVFVLRDIHVDGVVAVGTANTIHEGQVHYFWMLTEPPDVGLVTSQTSTMDAALLTCADADCLTVFHVADGVRLCIFQRDEGNDQVAFGLRGKGLVLRRNVLEEGIVVKLDFVASLLEGNAEDLLALNGLRLIVRIDLDHVIGTLALVLQDLDGLRGIVWGNHTIAHFALQDLGGGGVAGVA